MLIGPRLWRSMVESHGNHRNSTSRALETARDLIGVGAARDGEETLPPGLNPQARPSYRWSKLYGHKNRLWHSICRIASSVRRTKAERGAIPQTDLQVDMLRRIKRECARLDWKA